MSAKQRFLENANVSGGRAAGCCFWASAFHLSPPPVPARRRRACVVPGHARTLALVDAKKMMSGSGSRQIVRQDRRLSLWRPPCVDFEGTAFFTRERTDVLGAGGAREAEVACNGAAVEECARTCSGFWVCGGLRDRSSLENHNVVARKAARKAAWTHWPRRPCFAPPVRVPECTGTTWWTCVWRYLTPDPCHSPRTDIVLLLVPKHRCRAAVCDPCASCLVLLTGKEEAGVRCVERSAPSCVAAAPTDPPVFFCMQCRGKRPSVGRSVPSERPGGA